MVREDREGCSELLTKQVGFAREYQIWLKAFWQLQWGGEKKSFPLPSPQKKKKKKKAVTVYEKLILNDREQSQQIPTMLRLRL